MLQKATTMKLKTVEVDGKTYAEVQDGKPVFLGDDGKDIAVDVPGTATTITRLNGEAKTNRERYEAAEAKLKPFEAITDPAAALKAMETVANLDQRKLVDAGEVQKVKDEVARSFEGKLAEAATVNATLTQQLNDHIIGGSFASSKYAEDKVAVPRHMLRSTYGQNFKVEEGKLVPYDAAGNRIYSRARPGEVAEFDEALELLISADPYKDHILKGLNGAGGGAGNNGGGSGPKTMTQTEFNALDAKARAAKMAEGYTLAA